MGFYLLDDDQLLNFNFCSLWDPDLKPNNGPSKSQLYELAIKSREGDRFAPAEFADTISWTLRPATFDCFQRMHGPRPIEYRDWFYSKLYHFLSVLLYEKLGVYGMGEEPRTSEPWKEGVLDGDGPMVGPEELEGALILEACENIDWFGLVQSVSGASDDRLTALRNWLEHARGTSATSPRGSGWTKNEERDKVILNGLRAGREPRLICQELDNRTIGTLPALRARGHHNWLKAWEDPVCRRTIQQLFSKVPKRR